MSLKRRLGLLASVAVIGLSSAFGLATSVQAKPGHSNPKGPGPKKPPRKQAQLRQQAAEAKRERRQQRNLDRQQRGAFSRRT